MDPDQVEQSCINSLARLMIKYGLSTGHADTFEDLLRELEDQLPINKTIEAA